MTLARDTETTPAPSAPPADIPEDFARRAAFFLVGAPRCGTTAIAKPLSAHPLICFSKPKEPHFFTRFPGPLARARLVSDYFGPCFGHLAPEHLAWGEGSVSYLYQPEAIAEILALFPQAKFLVAIRNPIDLVYSHHARLLYLMDEEVTDFWQAWQLQDQRRQGRNLPKRCRAPEFLQYREVGRLGHHVGQLFDLAGRARCHVVCFDDWRRDPLSEYRAVLDFLGLPDDGRTLFLRKNDNRTYKSGLLQNLVVNRWPLATTILQRLDQQGRAAQTLKRLRRRLKKRNIVHVERPPLPEPVRAALRESFAEDIAQLSALLGRDFSHWR